MPLIVGGGQERGRRAGSEAPPLAAGFAAALAECQAAAAENAERSAALGEELWRGISAAFPDARRNVAPKLSAAHILSVHFPDLDAAYAAAVLDSRGVAVAASAACRAAAGEPSAAIGAAAAQSSIRFSFSPGSSIADARRALAELPGAVHLAGRRGNPWE